MGPSVVEGIYPPYTWESLDGGRRGLSCLFLMSIRDNEWHLGVLSRGYKS